MGASVRVKKVKSLRFCCALWKRKTRDLLDYHEGALDLIDGKLNKPDPLPKNADEAAIKEHKTKSDFYRKANSYGKSMITSVVTDAVYQKIMDKDTAYEAWEALKQNFEALSKDQLFKICTDFFAFSFKSEEDVSTYIAKIRGLWNELNNGLKVKKENLLPNLILVCKVFCQQSLRHSNQAGCCCQKMSRRLLMSYMLSYVCLREISRRM